MFFRSAKNGAPPGSIYMAPPGVATGLTPFPAHAEVRDSQNVDDHLAVQAIIRAYQVNTTKSYVSILVL